MACRSLQLVSLRLVHGLLLLRGCHCILLGCSRGCWLLAFSGVWPLLFATSTSLAVCLLLILGVLGVLLMSLWLLRNTRDGRVICDVNLADRLFDLLGQLCLDLFLVTLMLLINLLEIVVVVLVLTFGGSSLSSTRIPLPLLCFLLLCLAALGEGRACLLNLLHLYLLIAMHVGQLAIIPLEDDRLASNTRVDVENGRVLWLKVSCTITHRVFFS